MGAAGPVGLFPTRSDAVSDNSNGSDGENFEDVEKQTIDAFNQWHRFHENLIKLGDFTTWWEDGENKVDLVTFFVLDGESLATYKDALQQQIDFLDELRAVLSNAQDMIDQYQEKQPDAD